MGPDRRNASEHTYLPAQYAARVLVCACMLLSGRLLVLGMYVCVNANRGPAWARAGGLCARHRPAAGSQRLLHPRPHHLHRCLSSQSMCGQSMQCSKGAAHVEVTRAHSPIFGCLVFKEVWATQLLDFPCANRVLNVVRSHMTRICPCCL